MFKNSFRLQDRRAGENEDAEKRRRLQPEAVGPALHFYSKKVQRGSGGRSPNHFIKEKLKKEAKKVESKFKNFIRLENQGFQNNR